MLNAEMSRAAWTAENPGLKTRMNGKSWGKKLLYQSFMVWANDKMASWGRCVF